MDRICKDDLLELLNDEEIQSKIRKIIQVDDSEINDEKIEDLNQMIDQLKFEIDDKNKMIDQLRSEIDDKNITINQLKIELDQRFSKGWELFQQYQTLENRTKDLLHGVFNRNDFTAFICSGAQPNSLETIWDIVRDCVLNGQTHDSETLWKIFQYCLELVNASRVQASYSILTVVIGDRFDLDFHSEGPNSLAQGKIVRIYLPGFWNSYNRKIIRKSLVQVK